MFALGADAFIQPPHGGMVEEQSLHTDLENVDERIEALDVRQFVGDDSLQLIFGKAGERDYRQNTTDGTIR